MNEGSYFGFNDEFGNLCTAEWRAPGLTVVLETVGAITQIDAPSDGQYYVRQNGAWVVLPTLLAGLFTTGWFIETPSFQNQLSFDANGDLILRQLVGPNAGKSVNLTAGKWQ